MLNAQLAKELLREDSKGNSKHPMLKSIFNGDKIPKEIWNKEILNIEDESHWTPLTAMIALHRLNEIPEEMLTEETLNTPNSRGWTPLHRAIVWGYAAEVNYLLERGANPSIKTPDDRGYEDLAKQDASTPDKTLLKILNKAKLKRDKEIIQRGLTDAPMNI